MGPPGDCWRSYPGLWRRQNGGESGPGARRPGVREAPGGRPRAGGGPALGARLSPGLRQPERLRGSVAWGVGCSAEWERPDAGTERGTQAPPAALLVFAPPYASAPVAQRLLGPSWLHVSIRSPPLPPPLSSGGPGPFRKRGKEVGAGRAGLQVCRDSLLRRLCGPLNAVCVKLRLITTFLPDPGDLSTGSRSPAWGRLSVTAAADRPPPPPH
ncbi:hypothetical protein J1605_006872 [Eschrichtius robustus]|uniref:Uncharacterized protein n=1 Tax=Eschrichtius robustus TaxID=9764 RepID=A0AB34GZH8_ESCRO|nr:hypothetical protein J1605_006872 [Eschrichtius robustus]